MNRSHWILFAFSGLLLWMFGCQSQPPTPAILQEVPGFEGVPLHPQATVPRRVGDRVEFEIPNQSPGQVAQYYIEQLDRRGWHQVDRFSWVFVYERDQRQVLVGITPLNGGVKVAIRDYHPPTRKGSGLRLEPRPRLCCGHGWCQSANRDSLGNGGGGLLAIRA